MTEKATAVICLFIAAVFVLPSSAVTSVVSDSEGPRNSMDDPESEGGAMHSTPIDVPQAMRHPAEGYPSMYLDGGLPRWSTTNQAVFDRLIRVLMQLGRFPSVSMCAVQNGTVAWTKTYGYADVYRREKAHDDTTYVIGSISKMFTAIAVMQLHERGVIGLEDDVNRYLPFSLRNPHFPSVNITVRMLLSHRASLYDYHLYTRSGRMDLLQCLPLPARPYDLIRELLLPSGTWYAEEVWLNAMPGSMAAYSSMDILLLSYIVELVTGQSVEEYCYTHIMEPLEMDETCFHVDGSQRGGCAVPYLSVGGLYVPLPQYDLNCCSAIGGIRSTPSDLSHLLLMFLNDGWYNGSRILQASSVDTMFGIKYKEALFPLGFPHFYGLGCWGTAKFGEWLVGHGGSVPGFLAEMWMNRSRGYGFIMFANRWNPANPEITFGGSRFYPRPLFYRTAICKLILNNIHRIGNENT